MMKIFSIWGVLAAGSVAAEGGRDTPRHEAKAAQCQHLAQGVERLTYDERCQGYGGLGCISDADEEEHSTYSGCRYCGFDQYQGISCTPWESEDQPTAAAPWIQLPVTQPPQAQPEWVLQGAEDWNLYGAEDTNQQHWDQQGTEGPKDMNQQDWDQQGATDMQDMQTFLKSTLMEHGTTIKVPKQQASAYPAVRFTQKGAAVSGPAPYMQPVFEPAEDEEDLLSSSPWLYMPEPYTKSWVRQANPRFGQREYKAPSSTSPAFPRAPLMGAPGGPAFHPSALMDAPGAGGRPERKAPGAPRGPDVFERPIIKEGFTKQNPELPTGKVTVTRGFDSE